MKYNFSLTPEQRTLVEAHLHLVRWTIRRYIDTDETVVGLGFDDLFQEGAIGLCRAAATYDGTSARFSTYAVTVIRNHLMDHCRNIQASRKRIPVVSMDDCEGDNPVTPASADDADALLSEIASAELLAHFKRKYRGTARLGIEALEWKVKGYGVSDIAQLYHARPNYIGACVSRSVAKLRQEWETREFFSAPVEKEGQLS